MVIYDGNGISCMPTKPPGMQASIFGACPNSQAMINWEGFARKGIQCKNGGDGGTN